MFNKTNYALLIIDMVNNLEFEHGDEFFPHVYQVAKNILQLKNELKEVGVPVIYVNDNYGQWQSDFPSIVEHFLQYEVRGKPIVELIKPDNNDYFILKPKFSGFFATPLELLLDHLNVDTLILTGILGNMCVLFTANDAYMRDYKIIVPSDCVASLTEESNQTAILYMKDVLKADIATGKKISRKIQQHHLKV